MYFDYDELIDIRDILKGDYTYYAHLKDGEKETIEEHTERSFSYFKTIIEKKSIDKVFKNFEKYFLKDFSEESIKIFRKMLLNVPIFHDIGKLNPNFQIRKMDNKNTLPHEGFSIFTSDHSLISSVIYIDYYLKTVLSIEDKKEKKTLRTILFINAYLISKHHGDLLDFTEYLDKFIDGGKGYEAVELFYENEYINGFSISPKKIERSTDNTIKFLKKIDKDSSIYMYIYSKLLFSLLVASDYYAASEFMKGVEIRDFGDIRNKNEFYEMYKETNLYKNIRKYSVNREKHISKAKDINVLRSEMFLDAEEEILKNYKRDIFFMEAPTGSGKSNTALNLSFSLMEKCSDLNKIFYVYPFNTLVEQNLKSLKDIFSNDKKLFNKIAVINSIYPIKRKKDEEEKENCEEAFLDRQFLNYPMILTTHVSLFDTLFGNTKESNFGFYSLAGSVIVLDEIQSYKNTIWSEIITFLNEFCKILNMKVIIMSATLPDLKTLVTGESNCVNLIKDREKYFSNPFFKDRVRVNYDLFHKDEVYDELLKAVVENSKSNKKILIEFINKERAYTFYKDIREKVEVCELISGDDNILERERILTRIESEEIKEKGIVLAATQVIEAGVDIDMDIGYKDISKLDSEEQFMGRINRSCKKDGIVYFFSLDKAEHIYGNDIRINKSLILLNDEMKKILINKNFKDYYDLVLDILKKNYNDSFSDSNLESFFINKVGNLKFKEVRERMKLIDDNDYDMSVFLKRVIKVHGKEIDGAELWEEYKTTLKKNMEYAEKQIKLSEIRSKMNYFIYKVRKNNNLCYNDRIGDLICIDDGDKFFDGNKLDKEKFTQDAEIFI